MSWFRILADTIDLFNRRKARVVVGRIGRVYAPWSQKQVEAITRFQRRADVHPFTCETHSDIPLWCCSAELYCQVPHCAYSQEWVHSFMCEET